MTITATTNDSFLLKSMGYAHPDINNFQIVEKDDDVQKKDVGSLRTVYHQFLLKLFHEKHVTTVLELACGSAHISISLLEEGFKVLLKFLYSYLVFS